MHPVPVLYCCHDDHWFLRPSIRSFKTAGPVICFVSRVAWDGSAGDWEKCAQIAEDEGAEVIFGEWGNETEHRRHAQDLLRSRDYGTILIPDGDEVIEPALLEAVLKLAENGAAEQIHVSMQTYWRSPHYRIVPAERIRPTILVDLNQVQHRQGHSTQDRTCSAGS